jgi:hypothetical protein
MLDGATRMRSNSSVVSGSGAASNSLRRMCSQMRYWRSAWARSPRRTRSQKGPSVLKKAERR